jgi:hypothetical protein
MGELRVNIQETVSDDLINNYTFGKDSAYDKLIALKDRCKGPLCSNG